MEKYSTISDLRQEKDHSAQRSNGKTPGPLFKAGRAGTSAVLFWVAAALGDEAHQKFKKRGVLNKGTGTKTK